VFFFFFFFFKLTGYDLIFKDFFFKVQVNINLGSNIFFLFFNMGSFYSNWDKKYTKNTKKQMSVKNAIIVIKAQNGQKSPKKPNFEKAVSGRLHISLTADHAVNC
jgi:hypothetical protein